MNEQNLNTENILYEDGDSRQVELRVRLLSNSKVAYFFNRNYHKQPTVIIVWNYEQWRSSSLRMKGVTASCLDITSRNFIPKDAETIHPYRLQAMFYHNWDDVINDEKLYGLDNEEFIDELISFSKKHPLKGQTEIDLQEA